nr:MAG TPA: hypothetical protein [Bacteriophage sp.]
MSTCEGVDKEDDTANTVPIESTVPLLYPPPR